MTTETITRKKNTGEPGNKGHFGSKTNTEPTGVSLADTDNVFLKRYDTVEDKVEAFRDELDEKLDSLDTDENWQQYLDSMSRFHRYSFNNTLLIMLQRPNATRVAGRKVWRSLGRWPNQKGISIFAPRTVTVKATDKDGNPRLDENGKKITYKKMIGTTTTTVWDVSQTDGEPLPDIQRTLSEEPPEGFIDDLESAIKDAGYTVSYEKIAGTARGYTRASSKKVVVDETLPPGSRASTLAHELGHITAGHMEDMESYHTGHDGHRGRMEVEAESISYVLCRANGMDTVADTAGTYVKGWARREKDSVKAAGEAVAKAAKKLLVERDWVNTVPPPAVAETAKKG